jgi:ATP-binding cassette subfamily B protein
VGVLWQMKLLADMPDGIRAKLLAKGKDESDVLLCTETDLDIFGNLATEWFVVCKDFLIVFGFEEEQWKQLRQFDIGDIVSVRVDSRVGSGFLQVEVDGQYKNVIRYSNSYAYKFSRVASKIKDMLRGQEIVITEEDEREDTKCPVCGRMVDRSGGICSKCVNRGTVLKRILQLMKPYWYLGVIACALMIIGIGLDLVPPRLIGVLVDNVFGEEPVPLFIHRVSSVFGLDTHVELLATLVLMLVIAQVLKGIINMINGRLASLIGTKITFDLRQKIYRHLNDLSISFYDKNSVGQLMNRVMSDVEALQGFVWQIVNGFIANIILLGGIGVMLFTLNYRLALYTLIPAPLVIASTYVYWQYVRPRHYVVWDRRSKLSGILYASLSGIKVVKAFSQENRECNRFKRYSENLRDASMRVDKASSTFTPVVGFVFGLGGLIVWFVGGKDVLAGTITLGTLMAFIGYVGMFYGPLSQLSNMSQWFSQFITAAHRMFEILDQIPEITDSKSSIKTDIRGEIEFDSVTFGYDLYHPVIHDVSFKVTEGEMIGIVGPSGSGKTTLINLLCRFYDPTEGVVKLDGINLKDLQKENLRRQIGLVLQEPFLFRGTIAENIAYGHPDATMKQIIEAAKAANAHDFIVRLPDGYDTWLGESGSGLSGGERQRVSIARALLCDPKILILDEATSSVDTESERAIQQALQVLIKGRTTIAIAHRLSTLREADRIIVMEDGRIKEMGSHKELMDLGGLYHKLVNIQMQLTKDNETVDQIVSEAKSKAKA